MGAKKKESKELAAFDPLVKGIKLWVGPAEAARITDKKTKELGTTTLAEILALEKRVEEVRTEVVKPHNDLVKAVNARAKEVLAPLLKAKQILKARLIEYDDKVEEEARKERERIAKEKADAEAARDAKLRAAHAVAADAGELVQQAQEIHAEHDQAAAGFEIEERALKEEEVKGVGKRWVFEVVSLAEVPRQYLVVSEPLIREAVRLGVREIPGVRIYQEKTLAVPASKTVLGKPAAQLGTAKGR